MACGALGCYIAVCGNEGSPVSQIILDNTMLTKLLHVNGIVDLCDADGRVVGRFVPAFDPKEYENLEPPVTAEELKQIKAQRGGRTLAEIMADLEKRA